MENTKCEHRFNEQMTLKRNPSCTRCNKNYRTLLKDEPDLMYTCACGIKNTICGAKIPNSKACKNFAGVSSPY